jgi:uncharacterized protein YndB with AHSA1/START domain
MTTVQDKIEREITINAPIERVWQLVSQPGWWIGDGDTSGQKRYKEGELEVVEDPRYGKFPLRVEGSEEFRYVAFRWISQATEPDSGTPASAGAQGTVEPAKENSTLVEFWLSELSGGATLVRVVESGFSTLPGTDETRRRAFEGNTEGWRQQLDLLKSRAEHVAI